MSRDYRLVVFDWDGTLADSFARIVATARAAITDAGLPERSDAEIRAIIGLGVREAVAALYPDAPGEALVRLAGGYREHYQRAARETPAALFGGAADLLARLEHAGCLLAVATGKGRAGLLRELGELELQGRFAGVRTVDDCPSKPHPAMVEELMTECGAVAAETVVVGDTLFDLEMAANAGVDALGVAWGAHPPAELERARPRAVCGDFEALGRWLVPAARVQ